MERNARPRERSCERRLAASSAGWGRVLAALGLASLRPLSDNPRVRADGRIGRLALWRRPLWLAFVLGCLVSATTTGRFGIRSIVDGAVSFAFVPAFQVGALFIVCRFGARARMPFGETVDRFFAGNTPWILWLTLVAAAYAVVPPRSSSTLFRPALLGAIVPAVWSGYSDFLFFRRVMERAPAGAGRDLALQRLLGWSAGFAYFFGIAVWHEYVRPLAESGSLR